MFNCLPLCHPRVLSHVRKMATVVLALTRGIFTLQIISTVWTLRYGETNRICDLERTENSVHKDGSLWQIKSDLKLYPLLSLWLLIFSTLILLPDTHSVWWYQVFCSHHGWRDESSKVYIRHEYSSKEGPAGASNITTDLSEQYTTTPVAQGHKTQATTSPEPQRNHVL